MSNVNNDFAFDQKQADLMARSFNVGFNSAMLYGGDHPTTQKNVDPFVRLLHTILDTNPMVSIICDRDSIYIEEFCTDRAVNPKRIVAHFAKIGIQSISFNFGLTLNEVLLLFKLIGDNKAIIPVAQIQAALQAAGSQSISLNYVRYGKITTDQQLVGKGQYISDGPIDLGASRIHDEAIHEIEKVLSLAKLINAPEQTAQMITQSLGTADGAANATASLSRIRAEVESAEPQSIESLLNAVFELKIDLNDALAAQKMTGKILSSMTPVQKEMDNLTCDVIVKLVREEYSKGELPVRRLAQIIRRMLPDISELKRVLPQLKTALLNDGMTLQDYLQLVRMLDLELQSETLVTLLNDAASGIGVTVDDVVKAIRSEPKDAAKLMFLAAEIRHGTEQDDAQLSNLLTEYIEKVSTSIALDSKELSGPQGSAVLGKIVTQIEGQLLDKLKKYGIDEPVLLQVKSMLTERLAATCDTAGAQWMMDVVLSDGKTDTADISGKIASFLSTESQLNKIKDPLKEALTSRGFSGDQIQKFVNRLASHIASGKKIVLPSNALSSNNMIFLLNRELKQHNRYNTPFTTLLISIRGVYTDDINIRIPMADDFVEIVPQIYSIVKSTLRDIDLVGTLGGDDDHMILALLSMTPADGAGVVQKRLIKKLSDRHFKRSSGTVNILPHISLSSPEQNAAKDLKSYIELAKNNHAQS
jgi:hypothetical protein